MPVAAYAILLRGGRSLRRTAHVCWVLLTQLRFVLYTCFSGGWNEQMSGVEVSSDFDLNVPYYGRLVWSACQQLCLDTPGCRSASYMASEQVRVGLGLSAELVISNGVGHSRVERGCLGALRPCVLLMAGDEARCLTLTCSPLVRCAGSSLRLARRRS